MENDVANHVKQQLQEMGLPEESAASVVEHLQDCEHPGCCPVFDWAEPLIDNAIRVCLGIEPERFTQVATDHLELALKTLDLEDDPSPERVREVALSAWESMSFEMVYLAGKELNDGDQA